MSGLVRKITTGPTPMVPSRYSPEFKALIRALLCKEAEGRPSAAQVLELPWLQVMAGDAHKDDMASQSWTAHGQL